MRVIKRKPLLDFAKKYPNVSSSLNSWYRTIKRTNYDSLMGLNKTFPSADPVEGFTVFNIGGNKARLITAIHYNTKIVYIRHVLTHEEYDKGKWKG
ncbi:MAG: type II toxin-antitoxin system HigB family toxin [Cyclobacteriaceae bacterium]|nr:type II toxin-antitoxin system HigB family toxin [Cyclobacteriaceae bacterium]